MPGSRPSGEFTGGVESASALETKCARKMAGKWNGGGWAKDCSRRIEKVTRLPGADNHLRLPFEHASNPFLPPLSHSPVSIHISSAASPRYRIEESRHFSSCYEQCNALRELIRVMVELETAYFLRPHAYFR